MRFTFTGKVTGKGLNYAIFGVGLLAMISMFVNVISLTDPVIYIFFYLQYFVTCFKKIYLDSISFIITLDFGLFI